MNDEEYYKCFRIPKELVDDLINMIGDAAALAMNERITMMVKPEIGNHPDLDIMCQYYEDISQISANKIADELVKTAIEASQHATKRKKEDKKREQTGIQ